MFCTSTKLSKFILFAIKSQNGKNAEFLIFKSRSKIVHFIQWAEFYKHLDQALKVSSFSDKSWVTTHNPPSPIQDSAFGTVSIQMRTAQKTGHW